MTASSRAGGRTCILVLGMHRSGTSALAGALSKLGVGLPSHLMGEFPFNPKGHFEPLEVATLNDVILAEINRSWLDWHGIDDEAWRGEAFDGMVGRAADTIVAEFQSQPLFVLKEPRVSVLLPIWQAALARLGIEPLYLIPLRDPWEVADSLARRDAFSPEHALLLWLRYAIDSERATRGGRRLFIDIRTLMADPEEVLRRIGTDLRVEWPRSPRDAETELRAFLEPGMFSASRAPASAADPLVRPAFAAFRELLADAEAPQALAGLNQSRANLDMVAGIVDALRSQSSISQEQFVGLHAQLATLKAENSKLRGRRPRAIAGRAASAVLGALAATPLLPERARRRCARLSSALDPDRPA